MEYFCNVYYVPINVYYLPKLQKKWKELIRRYLHNYILHRYSFISILNSDLPAFLTIENIKNQQTKNHTNCGMK